MPTKKSTTIAKRKPGEHAISKLTRKRVDTIIAAVRLGMTQKRACEMVGIGESTLYRWLQEGEQSQRGLTRELWESLRKASAEAEEAWLAAIERASKGEKTIRRFYDKQGNVCSEREEYMLVPQWTAAAWKLERMHPERYAKRDGSSVVVNNTAIHVDVNRMSRDEVKERIRELEREQAKVIDVSSDDD